MPHHTNRNTNSNSDIRHAEDKQRILVVEDEDAIRIGLVDVLVFHGYVVDYASDGQAGLNKAQSGSYDLILLDVMLPKVNGYDICNALREANPHLPIIMLTAKSSDEDIIHGLRLGADDYVAKPFSVAQLVLRIEAVLRRTSSSTASNPVPVSRITFSNECDIDVQSLQGHCHGNSVSFTRKEMDVLQYLHQSNDRPVPREELLQHVWGYKQDMDIETRTVDIHIAKIRRKIEKDHKDPQYLLTIRGAGYRLMSE